MRILISDYPDVLASRDLAVEIQAIKDFDDRIEVEIYPYQDQQEFIERVQTADGLLTAFLDLDAAFFQNNLQLQCISINATGFDKVDLEAAASKNIRVVPLVNYCTEDVADHTLALLLSLNRKLKAYTKQIEQKHIWRYKSVGSMHRLSTQTLAIIGCGKIGCAVAKRAQVFGMEVIGYDPYKTAEELQAFGIRKADWTEIQERADIISNHVATTSENKALFNREFFENLEKSPLFLNLGRGENVEEAALLLALEQEWIRGAGLDVLFSEKPDLANEPLLHRENVIITPHASFYSEESLQSLQLQSVTNLVEQLEVVK
ncbi:NAD(P)-dependent oxidoreductase [Enterococcus olivae]